AGKTQILYRLAGISTAAVMASEVRQMIVELIGKQRLERLCRSLVERLAALVQHRAVRHLMRERVLEGVFHVWQRRLLVDELAELQIAEHPLQFVIRLA